MPIPFGDAASASSKAGDAAILISLVGAATGVIGAAGGWVWKTWSSRRADALREYAELVDRYQKDQEALHAKIAELMESVAKERESIHKRNDEAHARHLSMLAENVELRGQLADAAKQVEALRRDSERAATRVEHAVQAVTDRAITNSRDIAALGDTSGEKLDGLGKVAQATHTLVNSNYETQLHMHLIVAQRLASLTKDPADIEQVKMAEAALKKHMEAQQTVDGQPGTDAEKAGKA